MQAQEYHPHGAVISNDPWLAEHYDTHATSPTLMSQVLSAAQAKELLRKGVSFHHLVLVNGEGAELLDLIGDQKSWDNEVLPQVVHVTAERADDALIDTIHGALVQAAADEGIG